MKIVEQSSCFLTGAVLLDLPVKDRGGASTVHVEAVGLKPGSRAGRDLHACLKVP